MPFSFHIDFPAFTPFAINSAISIPILAETRHSSSPNYPAFSSLSDASTTRSTTRSILFSVLKITGGGEYCE
jgi:hypothetical protein